MSSFHLKHTSPVASQLSPYVSRKESNRSQSSDGQSKLKTPRVCYTSRAIIVNTNPPTMPVAPPVCKQQQQQQYRTEQHLTNLRDILRVSHQQERMNLHNMNKRSPANIKQFNYSMHEIGRATDTKQQVSHNADANGNSMQTIGRDG